MFTIVNEVLAPCPPLVLLMSLLLTEEDPVQNKVCSLVRGGPAAPGDADAGRRCRRAPPPGAGRARVPRGSRCWFVLSPEAIARLLFEAIAGRPVRADKQGGMGPHGAISHARRHVVAVGRLSRADSPGARLSARGTDSGGGAAGPGWFPSALTWSR